VKVDYRKLRDLLKAHDWQVADQETAAQMLKVIGKDGWWKVERNDLLNSPCKGRKPSMVLVAALLRLKNYLMVSRKLTPLPCDWDHRPKVMPTGHSDYCSARWLNWALSIALVMKPSDEP
jgi:hypothetical protein